MSILDKIIQHKIKETEERKSLYPVKLLERSIYFETKPVSLKHYILRKDKEGIIAEFKHKSPSKGMINEYASVEKVSIGYMQSGASALSILTETEFFGGKSTDLTQARQLNFCPILRKDFIVDEYQVIESKSIGADAILLIAAVLDKAKISSLTKTAKSLGLEIVFEVHSADELEKVDESIDIIGVNNRDLKTFVVNIDTSKKLSEKIPAGFIRISESGISEATNIIELKKFGFNGFLIGETFMRSSDPEHACAAIIREIKCLNHNA